MPTANGSDSVRQPRLDNPAEITAPQPGNSASDLGSEAAEIRPGSNAAVSSPAPVADTPSNKLIAGDDKGATAPNGMKSCLSGGLKSPATDNAVRTDARGVVIERGKKKHRTAFIDEVKPGTGIAEVKEVAQYKDSQGGGCCVIS